MTERTPGDGENTGQKTARRAHPINSVRAFAKAVLPQRARYWLRRRLAPYIADSALVRRLLGAGGAPYRYVSPRRPADLAGILAEPGLNIRFSIVTPTWNTPPVLLEAMIASVQAQWYPHWQLILADDASPSQETRTALAQISDPRIQVLFTEQNGGISAATNRAIAAATGDYYQDSWIRTHGPIGGARLT